MENQDENIAAAQKAFDEADAGVTAAEESAKSDKAALKTARAELKEGKANLKAAQKAFKHTSGQEDASEEDVTQAEGLVTQWDEHVKGIEKRITTLTETTGAASQVIRDAKAARTEARKALTSAKKTTKPKVEREKQNGVMRPLAGSNCGNAWDLFDELTANAGSVTMMAPAVAIGKQRGMNEGNVRCEFTAWKKFHGHGNPGRAKDSDMAAMQAAHPDVPEFAQAAKRVAEAEADAKAKANAKAAKAAEKAAEAA